MMATVTLPPFVGMRSAPLHLPWAVSDALVIAKRILVRVLRSPEELASSTSTPIIFVLLFRYVFGGAIDVGRTGYVNYLMAGIFVQTVAITSLAAGTGVAQDLQSGLIDRLRSLPIARSAVVSGRVVATLVRSVFTLAVVALVGVVVGFRPHGGPGAWTAALGLLLLFGFALAWVGIAAGLLLRNPEAVQNVAMTLVFPLTFLSSAFVPTRTLPGPLRVFVAAQPMTHVVDAVRDLVLSRSPGMGAWAAVAWSAAILAVFAPLAVVAYGRAASR
jgi:ABC-2 type transport system permease protein/oleandomycin transport system permease protein